MKLARVIFDGVGLVATFCCGAMLLAADAPQILTPPPPTEPQINGPALFGARPGSPFLYTIPATGKRPMEFSVQDLPAGLTVDAATGQIRGMLKEAGEYKVGLQARNGAARAGRRFASSSARRSASRRPWAGTVGTAGRPPSIRTRSSARPAPWSSRG